MNTNERIKYERREWYAYTQNHHFIIITGCQSWDDCDDDDDNDNAEAERQTETHEKGVKQKKKK